MKSTVAQFAPQAELAGSTAIPYTSSSIVEWATQCSIHRGWQNIADTILGYTNLGDSTKALGIADGDVVSLGDGGEAIFYFSNPIQNGPGYDFAVFENGFRNPLDSNLAYLELAKVFVSNDGNVYYEFPSQCDNDTSNQIAGAGEYMDARKLNNLAGKYIQNYGTPFDLDELSMILSLDVDNIHYVKIKDVVGSLSKAICSNDATNQPINDPYPTPFYTGGFDLDALGVINHKYPTAITQDVIQNEIILYPNPCQDVIYVKNCIDILEYKIYRIDGILVQENNFENAIDIKSLANGFYLLETTNNKKQKLLSRFMKI